MCGSPRAHSEPGSCCEEKQIQRASYRLHQARKGSAPGEAGSGYEEKEALGASYREGQVKRWCPRKQVLGASFGKNQVRRMEATGQGESCSEDRQARLTSSKTGWARKEPVPGAGSSHRGAAREGGCFGSWVAVKL